jgi:hypothetical protein
VWIFGPLYIVPFIFSFHAWVWTPAPESHTGRSWWTDYSWFGSGFSATGVPSYMWYLLVGFSVLWLIVTLTAGTIVQIMAQRAQLDAAQGNDVISFGRLWPTVKELGWQLFGLYLLIGLYVSLPTLVWVLLFIALGGIAIIFFPLILISLIMLRRYFLAPYVLIDKKLGISDAMDTSAEMTKPNSAAVWSVIGVMVLIASANLLPGVGWLIAFVLGSLYSVAPALRYQELKKLS